MTPPAQQASEQAAARWLASQGITSDAPQFDGAIHRGAHHCRDKARDDAGWYVVDLDPAPHGACGCWRCGHKETWTDSSRPLSDDERRAVAERAAARNAKIEDDQRRAAHHLRENLARLDPAPADHPYLLKKGISAHGALVHPDGFLVLPLVDAAGEIWSAQGISDRPRQDWHGRTKSFEGGSRTKGTFFEIGRAQGADRVVIAEGYATGATIHEETGLPVLCAMSAGNLEEVTAAATEKFGHAEIIVAADNDRHTDGNPGRTQATAAARKYDALLAVPDFGDHPPEASATDFNDLARLRGRGEVMRQIDAATTPKAARGNLGKFEVNLPDDFGTDMPSFLDRLGAALVSANQGRAIPTYVRRSDSLAFVTGTGSRTKLVQATDSTVRAEVQRDVSLLKRKKDSKGRIIELKAGEIPAQIAKDIARTSTVCQRLPEVVGVTGCPLISRRGEITASGYSPEQRLLVASDFWGLEEMDGPTAKSVLLDFFSDFVFVTEADRARAAASLLQPALVLGGSIDRGPILLVTAAERSTGKGTLVRMRSAVYSARPTVISIREGGVGSLDEDLSSKLIDGGTFISVDNARGRIASQLFEAALTEDVVSCRKPHRSAVDVETAKVQWSITSNSVSMTEDLASRCCAVRLRKREAGFQFKTTQPVAWATENRGRILSAAFAVVRAWIARGCPKASTGWNDHHRQFWAVVDWIVPELLGLPAPTSGASAAAMNATDPLAELFRGVGIELQRRGESFPKQLRTIPMLRIAGEAGLKFAGREIPPDDHEIEGVSRSVGIRARTAFAGRPALEVDEFTVTRVEETESRETGGASIRTAYLFEVRPAPSAPSDGKSYREYDSLRDLGQLGALGADQRDLGNAGRSTAPPACLSPTQSRPVAMPPKPPVATPPEWWPSFMTEWHGGDRERSTAAVSRLLSGYGMTMDHAVRGGLLEVFRDMVMLGPALNGSGTVRSDGIEP